MGFRLVLPSMHLNDLERRSSRYSALFHRIRELLEADYVTVVEDSPIISAKYRIPCFTFGQN